MAEKNPGNLAGLRFELQDEGILETKIKVVGVGGGGSNAVARMMSEGLAGVEFFVLNTDKQALMASPVPNKVAIGQRITGGLGAGSDPAVGREAALEDTDHIIEILQGADMVFVTAGMGGGTGTGAAPVVATLAKELNALTVAVVTKPFGFEGPRRAKQAERGLAELAATVDTVIPIPNNRLLELVPKGTSLFDAFRIADDVLLQAVRGISDIITTPGIINRDYSDIRSIMLGMGYAMMGTAVAKGENATVEAARNAISSPMLDEGGVAGARGILINITGSTKSLGLHDVDAACSLIREAAKNEDVHINFGVVLNENMADGVKITVIATGFERESFPAIQRRNIEPRAAQPTTTAEPQRVESPLVFDVPATPEPEPAVEINAEYVEAPAPPPTPQQAAAPPTAPPAAQPPTGRADETQVIDLDVPAFLRRERKLFQ